MHGNDKLGQHQGTPLLGVCQCPYSAQCFIGQAGLVKDLPGLVTSEHISLKGLSLEQAGVLRHLVRCQGRDADGAAGTLRLNR